MTSSVSCPFAAMPFTSAALTHGYSPTPLARCAGVRSFHLASPPTIQCSASRIQTKRMSRLGTRSWKRKLVTFVEKKRVFFVRLGKFKNLCSGDADNDVNGAAAMSSMRMEEGETSSNNLDARKCFSIGYYQYVVVESNLQVALNSRHIREDDDGKGAKGRGINERSAITEMMEGKRLGVASRGESFSVSKIWQLSNKKGKFPVSSGNNFPVGNLSWIASVADA